MPALRVLQRLTERQPGPVTITLGVTVCVAAPTAVRLALSPLLGNTLWFPTYYPAVLLAGLWLGWRSGLAVLLLSALSADYFFVPPAGELAHKQQDVAAISVFLLAAGLILLTAVLLREALVRLNRASALERTLNRELQHRIKNTLAVTQGLALQSMRTAGDAETFYGDFRNRLTALGRAQDLLSSGKWTECEFPELPEAALEPFRGTGSIRMAGPRCSAPSDACVPLVLALHELATNAVKHGALSAPGGEVLLTWSVETNDHQEPRLRLEWVEQGGPPVTAPKRRGLGSKLLVPQAGLEAVDVFYAPSGVKCTILVDGIAPSRRAERRRPPHRIEAVEAH